MMEGGESAEVASHKVLLPYFIDAVWEESLDEDDRKKENIFKKHFKQICQEKLNGSRLDPDAWPSRRDLKTFMRWFDVEFHSLVFDLVDKPTLVVE